MRLAYLGIVLVFMACNSSKSITKGDTENKVQFVPQYMPGPQALVYKTKKEYVHLVPVQLSEDKSEIISYPHPTDVKVGGVYTLPTFLHNGYFLDNRGIGKNTAFLKLTYDEYAALKKTPTLAELYTYILDKDPLVELCDCGNKTVFTDVENQLNELIDNKQLRSVCRVIK